MSYLAQDGVIIKIGMFLKKGISIIKGEKQKMKKLKTVEAVYIYTQGNLINNTRVADYAALGIIYIDDG